MLGTGSELGPGKELGQNREPWCTFKGKGFIPPSLKPLAGLDERAGCHLVPYRLRILASIAATSVLFMSLTLTWADQHAEEHLPVETHRRQIGRLFRTWW